MIGFRCRWVWPGVRGGAKAGRHAECEAAIPGEGPGGSTSKKQMQNDDSLYDSMTLSFRQHRFKRQTARPR